MDPVTANNEILPLFLVLAQDRQDSVRLQSVDNAVALAKLVSPETLTSQLIPVICTAAKDTAWRVRWSVANRLPEICEAVGADLSNSVICDSCLIPLLGDSEAEVKTAAASRVLIEFFFAFV